jgi:hypothetical protein
MSLIFASVVLGLDGILYCGLGLCMLIPSEYLTRRSSDLARLYPSLFKAFLELPASQASFDGAMSDSDSPPFHSVLNGSVRPIGELVRELGFRLLAYLLLLAGVCRIITGVHWGCGFVYLGLGTCLAEIGMICNELLREEAVLLHRGMVVLLCNVVLSLVYLSAGLPYCR